ncbi:hypothetical protein LTR37_009236 [Vermiconidia calcicola]|uniref:Uncharacterized protein n=1 Tax=Vermiconidia calcicola TaxID=1690605 RepID=A0ACC3N8W8_9PEZI|nr:hypothetical protein LTR37_009236 [Vermiconidia calcicola]
MSSSRRWTVRIVLITFLILAVTSFAWCVDVFRFERFLDSLFITYDDFTKDYAEALRKASSSEHREVSYDVTNLAETNLSSSIPHMIHFIWFKDLYDDSHAISNIPSGGSNAPNVCREHNPDFEIKEWDAVTSRELLQQHYAWFLPTYDGYRYPIQRVDAIKYFLLDHFGGIYMDLDIACRRPLAPLLPFPAWFPRASPLGVNNDLMASRAGHPVVRKMIATLQARNVYLLSPWLTIFWSTGPRFTSDVLKVWWHQEGAKHFSQGTDKGMSALAEHGTSGTHNDWLSPDIQEILRFILHLSLTKGSRQALDPYPSRVDGSAGVLRVITAE